MIGKAKVNAAGMTDDEDDAYDMETGRRIWRCYTVPKPGESGSETWPAEGEAWARGGANCWTTPTFDPDLNLLYFNTGNPSNWDVNQDIKRSPMWQYCGNSVGIWKCPADQSTIVPASRTNRAAHPQHGHEHLGRRLEG